MTPTFPQAALQKLVFDLLTASTNVTALADGIYDLPPPNPFNGPHQAYVSFGPVDVIVDDAECIVAGIHTLQLDCWSRQHTSVHCKRLTDAVYAALHEVTASLPDPNALVEMRVTLRQIMRDPDGLTTHGVLQLEADIEEAN
jgi:Protein of unknown function (DUF3168)